MERAPAEPATAPAPEGELSDGGAPTATDLLDAPAAVSDSTNDAHERRAPAPARRRSDAPASPDDDPFDPTQTDATPLAPDAADGLLSRLAGDEIDRLARRPEPKPPTRPEPPTDSAPSPQPTPPAAPVAAAPAGGLSGGLDGLFGGGGRGRPAAYDDVAPDAAGAAPPEAVAEPPQSPDPADDGGVPLLLRPLAWLSAPLDLLPDWARAAAGQIAVLTLLNAAAVLLYVALFRR